jgi:hypothetical protein
MKRTFIGVVAECAVSVSSVPSVHGEFAELAAALT